MKKFKNKRLRELARVLVEHGIDCISNVLHEASETQSGDITPLQAIELEQIKTELTELLFQQTKQNR